MQRLSMIPLVLLLASCVAQQPEAAGVPAPATPAQHPAAADTAVRLPNDVHWVRNSAEFRALTIQTYRWAATELERLVTGRASGSWAVIIDADETVLDNSEYQRRLALRRARFDIESWNNWVRERAAPATPGAVEFTRRVRDLGGLVAIVTNRDEIVCDATRENLAALGVPADVVLCKPMEAPSDKQPRFRSVAEGTAHPDLPPAEVVMFLGDNIHDFPALTQELRLAPDGAFARFGTLFIVLPNPMYGSWERNPPR